MSSRKELATGTSDKEGKTMAGSEGKEEEEQKSKENVSEADSADKKNARASGEQNVDSDSPSKQQKLSNVPHEKSREQSKRHHEELKPHTASDEPDSDSGSDYDPDSDSNSDENQYWPDEVFLFEMETPSTNRLVIPFDLASAHFPPLATRKRNEKQVETLQFTDSQNREWYMPIQYYRDERGFMILTGWQKFSTQYNLKPMDLIRIYEPVPRFHTHHFLIEVEKKGQTIDPPEFREENFLFQIELDQSDIDFRRVFLARDDVRNFPGVKMQRNSREKKIMRFTDANCKDWYMNIIRYSEGKYMVIDGWDEFVKERGLQAGDLIGFYQHVHPYHRKHYLIGIVKKEGGGGPRPGQAGGGSGAGSSSQSYKGKEIAGGD
ncbi:hypothetical protein Vadar_027739 [Vaccinium darrowii]|uniref:Uncharacterized protein n=1 Tax=Vaccinium darrowii TaxID=229202 RepID=A0ACB7ZE81_9ERIC|nr:hypothetical protein Vadar_027739 [Vaccinium darrowii]